MSDVHVHCVTEGIAHELSYDCWCGPECVPIESDDGSIGYLYQHHTIDGRELEEIPREAD